MKKIIAYILLVAILFSFDGIWAKNEPNDKEKEIRAFLGEAYIADEDYQSAIEEYNEILKEDPKNVKARIGLADILSWEGKFKDAIKLYREVLRDEYDREAKRKLADVLSWDKKYSKTIFLYNELLDEKYDKRIACQKARVLGWWKKYDESLKAYRDAYRKSKDELIALEMSAKEAYWNSRVEEAITAYSELIEKDPENVEAMFDLSQIYSYQSMWKQATGEYEKILEVHSGNFRAREGLEKAELISSHILSNTAYDYFEADSPSRHNDIRRHSSFEEVSVPINDSLKITAATYLTTRYFRDFNDVFENNDAIKAVFVKGPDYRIEGFYSFFAYNKGIKAMHNFGGVFDVRIFDIGTANFSYERERLENNSTVIREHYYRDRFKERIDIDVNKWLKLGADFIFAYYSDYNYKTEPGFDLLYFFSIDPLRFSVKYRYYFREFSEKEDQYFSPKGFTVNKITLNWRHYLNKEEVFFGANDLYYDLNYEVKIDSETIVGHGFSGELNWDINKRLNINVKGKILNSSANVYNDKSFIASVKYYF
ncbi:MAG: tetratricopeptide repeat protein [Candidatus Omnitrophica bacterium]|nr:tetratricopeptide repeat protein [Candidatus Omnitrophota bacterium]